MFVQTITKAQRAALKRVFDRTPLYIEWNGKTNMAYNAMEKWDRPLATYRQFRKLAVVSFDCLMVPWCGMWLGIEKDGYTHS